MRYILGWISVIVLAGCSVSTPAVSEYRLAPTSEVKQEKALACAHTLKVQNLLSSAALMTQRLYYGVGQYKQFAYTQAAWSDTPQKKIGDLYVALLREREIFQSVHSYRSNVLTDRTLEIVVDDFMQYYDEDYKNSHAKVGLTLTLIDTAAKKPLATKSFKARKQAPSLDAQGGVDALNEALQEVMEASALWLEGECK
ncbi:MAG: ABC-type transport auxiliary lipoprotein family protein [Thiovulaceae bacterium]|nr:ABC-type transport auxiliary lipoprotein family protein [Sulfurimonadaceae bacterium]MDD3817803.1 ABC-type transport auxiliary lipoprotein family protein [Sulfurimonadaceae bacterium]